MVVIQTLLYVFFIVLGFSAPCTEPIILISMGILLLGTVCASLVIPFGGIDKTKERASEYVLQYGPIAFIGWHVGNTAVFIGHKFDVAIIGSIVFVGIILMSYWKTSFHSREYRFNVFRSMESSMPATSRLVFRLKVQRFSALADQIIIAIAEKAAFPESFPKEAKLSEAEIAAARKEFEKHLSL